MSKILEYLHRILIITVMLIPALLNFSISVFGQEPEVNKEIKWYSFEEATEGAALNQKKVLLFMEADWCAVCKRMIREVFPEPEIQKLLKEYFYTVRVDIESRDKIVFQKEAMSKMEFSKRMNMYATPTFIFIDQNESVIGTKPGFMNSNEFSGMLRFIYTEAYLEYSYSDFIEQ